MADIARHVTDAHFEPSFLGSDGILYDVASNFCQVLPRGNVFGVLEHENAAVASGRRIIENKHADRDRSTTYLQEIR